MKKLLLTTILAFPLAMGPAFAQDTNSDATTQDETVQVPDATTDATDDAATDMDTDAGDAADTDAADTDDSAVDGAADIDDGAMDADTGAADDPAATDMDATDTIDEPGDVPITDAPAADDTDAMDAADEDAVVVDDDKVVREQSTDELRLKWVTGATVLSPDGEKIGAISDLILDKESGQMVAAVVGVGGFLGIGEKKIALPWDRLTIDYDANEVSSDLTRDEADAAPEYAFRDREDAPAPVMDTMDTAPASMP